MSDAKLNSTAEKLAIYSDFRYISQIFPTLFSKLISILIRLLHTFSMGAKTRARDSPKSERFASDMHGWGT